MSLERSRGRRECACFAGAAALVALSSFALPAAADCGMPQRRPPPESCASELAAAARMPGAPDPVALDGSAALLARADALRRSDDLSGAERALACAGVQPETARDPRRRYEVVRRLGIVDYGLGRPVEALDRFECALGMAEALEDRVEIARQLKNVGSSLRRIGDYAGAIRALVRSLEMQRATGGTAFGPVLNNIADVHREMEQRDDAERYYREALAAFRSAGDVVQAMHVYDSLADLAIDRRDIRAATALLEEALRDLRAEVARDGGEAGALRYQLLIRAGLIRASLAEGDTAAARRHLADALALAETHGLGLPSQLQLEAARTERLSGRTDAALARLREAAAAADGTPGQQAVLLRELSLALQASGREGEALEALRRAYDRELDDLRAQRDRGLAWSNARLNLNESRRQLAEAEARGQRRTLQLWLTAISALATLTLLALLFQRRHQRARQAEAVRRARYEEALARYRREYEALAEDRHLLQALLDSREEALVLTDGDGVVQAVNRAACEVLGADADVLVGASLTDRFEAESAKGLRGALEHMEDVGTLAVTLTRDAVHPPLLLELRQWERGDGKIVVALRGADDGGGPPDGHDDDDGEHARVGTNAGIADAALAARPDSGTVAERSHEQTGGPVGITADAVAPANGENTDVPAWGSRAEAVVDAGMHGNGMHGPGMPDEGTDDTQAQRQRFRRELVELMLALVEAWERSTGHNRIELAERSRIWRVNIDDGRLRARAMERYLSLSKLPRNPRWRDVLRSAYYVLSHCEAMPAQIREDLQRRVDALLEYDRLQAMS